MANDRSLTFGLDMAVRAAFFLQSLQSHFRRQNAVAKRLSRSISVMLSQEINVLCWSDPRTLCKHHRDVEDHFPEGRAADDRYERVVVARKRNELGAVEFFDRLLCVVPARLDDRNARFDLSPAFIGGLRTVS